MNENLNLFNNMPESYWISSTKANNYPSLDQDIDVDILIVGGGMAGILSAYQLSKEGFSIAILEAKKIIQLTTAHTSAKITSQHGLIYNKLKVEMGNKLAYQYAQANEFAIREIKKIADENNINCDFQAQTSYIYTEEDKYIKQIEDEVNAAKSLGIKAKLVDEIALPISIKAGMVFENQAEFHPRKFLLPLAEKLYHDGVKIYENTRAIELNESDNGYIVNTDQGKKIRANKVIIASQYPFYNKKKMYYSKIYMERSYVLAIKAKEKFPGGIYINAEDPPRSLRSHSTQDGELILVVGENHKTGQGEDTNKHYQALLSFAKSLFTIEDIPYRWSTQDCMTLDGVPYIGEFAADTPNLYLATGFNKWGMTNSMVSSIILRDLIVKGHSPWKEVYDPSRKMILTSSKEFLVQNSNVASQLIAGKLLNPSKDIVIKPGQGKIIQVDGKRAGAFRDEDGGLHLVNTTCTHLGCELNWNSAERSWDCPCHGSRFTYKGDIIQGPANRPLSFDLDVNIFKRLFKEDF